MQHTQSQLSGPSEDSSKSLNDLGDLQEVMRQKPLKVSVVSQIRPTSPSLDVVSQIRPTSPSLDVVSQIRPTSTKKWVWLARLYWMKKSEQNTSE